MIDIKEQLENEAKIYRAEAAKALEEIQNYLSASIIDQGKIRVYTDLTAKAACLESLVKSYWKESQ